MDCGPALQSTSCPAGNCAASQAITPEISELPRLVLLSDLDDPLAGRNTLAGKAPPSAFRFLSGAITRLSKALITVVSERHVSRYPARGTVP